MRIATVVLPVPGFPVMQSRTLACQTDLLAQICHKQQRRYPADVSLHRFETNQFTIQFIQDFLKVGIPMSGPHIDQVLRSILGNTGFDGGICI
jgi:hypothetical protein